VVPGRYPAVLRGSTTSTVDFPLADDRCFIDNYKNPFFYLAILNLQLVAIHPTRLVAVVGVEKVLLWGKDKSLPINNDRNLPYGFSLHFGSPAALCSSPPLPVRPESLSDLDLPIGTPDRATQAPTRRSKCCLFLDYSLAF